MKSFYVCISLALTLYSCYGQTISFDTLKNRGEAQFDANIEKPDYGLAIDNLIKAIKLKPKDAEIHYFLAYAYSRFNSSDASTIPKMKLPLVIKASRELEKVISLSPLYTGKIISLDPYSKITSEWGSLALCYLANNKPDSAAWAFKEGKRMGGFDNFILAINRAVLNSCSKNSIIIPSGDDYTLPLYYLNVMEKLRTDVSIVDISMLNTEWYPRFIEKTTPLKFGIKRPALDTIEYMSWSDSTISIPVFKTDKIFSWVLKPSYQDNYILRGDRLFLNLLRENRFNRDIYFTKGFAPDELLSLTDYLLSYPLIDKLNAKMERPESNIDYVTDIQKMAPTFKPCNPNSQDELLPISLLRWDIKERINNTKVGDPTNMVVELNKLLDDVLSEKDFPQFSN